ncbi:methyltransferase-like protein 7A isoform X2 [Denticeps clupeoides]|uniref:methyltransferase-like protein 7A isoform X2 n=1 Tax=Denticeps clupeoides TaxID=299321 RepID=UPI0010A33703|nr:methyltransferase-like protein 7A isoform X2 [Denticeps clupeoides]
MSLLLHACLLLVKMITLPLRVAELLGLFSLYKRVFPFIMYKVTFNYNNLMNDKKRELFRNLSRFYPADGPLRILEIGCGTGANFAHYPTGCHVTCTDPNPHFLRYLQESMEQNQHLVYDRFVVASGEDLRQVEDASVDVVVCTLVLCSVRKPHLVLKEALRVLRPGGAFFFLEHVVFSDPSSWGFFLQHVLQPLWYYCCDGCETTRATWKHLEAAEFSDLSLQHIQGPFKVMIRPHIVGYAIK